MITKLAFLCTIIRCFYLKYSTVYIVSSDTIYRRNTSGEKKNQKKEVPNTQFSPTCFGTSSIISLSYFHRRDFCHRLLKSRWQCINYMERLLNNIINYNLTVIDSSTINIIAIHKIKWRRDNRFCKDRHQ